VKATTAAMIGVSILLLTRILDWKDILQEHSAWDTLIWFATLITLACRLNTTGFSGWFSQGVAQYAEGLHWSWGILLLGIIYYYSHYFFASAVAHISSMYAPFLLVAVAIGTPPALAALLLAFFSNLFMGLTHYGSGAAPILFGTGYVTVGEWWKAGAMASFLFIFVWLVVGGIWWKILGFW
jgi:DASS family divalent anion:Na+ symporter